MLVRHTITSLRLSYSRSTKGGRVSAKYRRALALTSVLVISTSILTPPVCPTPTPWSVSAAHAAPPGATPPGNLTMNASLDRSGTVQVKGALRTHTKQPVSGALINLAVDGKPLAVGVTHDNGSWSGTFRLPPTMQAGTHELSATFDGTEGGRGSLSKRHFLNRCPTHCPHRSRETDNRRPGSITQCQRDSDPSHSPSGHRQPRSDSARY